MLIGLGGDHSIGVSCCAPQGATIELVKATTTFFARERDPLHRCLRLSRVRQGRMGGLLQLDFTGQIDIRTIAPSAMDGAPLPREGLADRAQRRSIPSPTLMDVHMRCAGLPNLPI
jgi:hypothetical protein